MTICYSILMNNQKEIDELNELLPFEYLTGAISVAKA